MHKYLLRRIHPAYFQRPDLWPGPGPPWANQRKYEPFPFTGVKEATMTECSKTETNGIRVVILEEVYGMCADDAR